MSLLQSISSEELEKFVNGEKLPYYFVMVKSPTCGICVSLGNNKEFFKKPEWFREFTFTPQDKKGLEIISKIGISTVPFLIYHYKDKISDSLGTIIPDPSDLIETENIFDALYDNDPSYFGYNEYDEEIASDKQYSMLRLLHKIYGELPSETSEIRKELNSITK